MRRVKNGNKSVCKKAGMLVGMLGIIAGCFQGYQVHAEDVTQKTPPEKVNITVHKLMYDQGTQLNVDIDGIKTMVIRTINILQV